MSETDDMQALRRLDAYLSRIDPKNEREEHKVSDFRALIWRLTRQAAQLAAPASEPVGEIVLFGGDLKEVSWRKGRMPAPGTKLYAAPQGEGDKTVDAGIPASGGAAQRVPEKDHRAAFREQPVNYTEIVAAAPQGESA